MKKLVILTSLLLMLLIPFSLGGKSLNINNDAVKVENLGTHIESATLEGLYQIQLPGSYENHWLFYYVSLQYQQRPFQIVDVNLDTGSARVVDGVLGRPGWQSTIVHSNGKVYVASGSPGYLMVYDPQSGTRQTIATLADDGGPMRHRGG